MSGSSAALTPAVEAKALSLWYGDFQALHQVSVSFESGAITALIGPSGCGKTTLLKCVNRMHDRAGSTRTEGQLLLHGHDVLSPAVSVEELRRHAGLVFQRPNPLPLSIFDNVAFAARLFEPVSRAQLEGKVRDALERVGLWSALHDKLDQGALSLSLEQQQRLCIARLLPLQPRVLLMDEPCSALDPSGTHAVESLVRELRGDFTTIIVTHSMAQARRLSDRCVFMWLGKVVEAGPTAQLFEAPRDEKTRAYLGGDVG